MYYNFNHCKFSRYLEVIVCIRKTPYPQSIYTIWYYNRFNRQTAKRIMIYFDYSMLNYYMMYITFILTPRTSLIAT